MGSLKYITAGESHGPQLTAIVEGIPAGLFLTEDPINYELSRRRIGYGRGGRMQIERDMVSIISGVRGGYTTGAPITLVISNKDWENWKKIMQIKPFEEAIKPVTEPRPGHADLAGILKYQQKDIRNIIERSSARETASRVAVGAVAKELLKCFGIKIISHVIEIGGVRVKRRLERISEIEDLAEGSDLRCAERETEELMKRRINEARERGDTVGGVFEIIAEGVPAGLGSYTQWDKRIDGKFAQALMSIPAVKGVEIGIGFEGSALFGSQVHDEIFYRKSNMHPSGGFYRNTNRAGGIEGGVTNGEAILLRCAMKPISTLLSPLRTVDIITKEEKRALVERSDVCAVPAAAVVGEAMVAIVLADCMLEKFGGDTIRECMDNYNNYLAKINEL